MVRALPDEPLLSRSPRRHKSLIGVHMFGDDVRLVLKLSFRKNTRSVTIAMRPCFCATGGFLPRSLCPIHSFWVSLISHTPPGRPLFPTYAGRNIIRILKRAFTNASIVDGSRYTPHCFRRGAANAILQSGSSLATIMLAGGWTSGAYRSYLELHRQGELNMASVFSRLRSSNDSDSDPSSPESYTLPTCTSFSL